MPFLPDFSPVAKTCFKASVLLLALSWLPTAAVAAPAEKKIAVLLVNHGSRSETWRKSLLTLEDSVRPKLLTNRAVKAAARF